MAQILLKGIARYPHLFTPSAPRGTTTRRYSIDLLVRKDDPAIQQALQAQEADKQATFPQGVPPKADMFIADLAQVPGTDPMLHNYYNVSFSTKEEQGAPEVVDLNYQKVINPNAVQPGDIVWVGGNSSGYTVGDQGVKCYLNAVMTTGEKGDLPTELLSARPSAQQVFAGVPGAGQGAPAPQQPAGPAPTAAPAPAGPPPAAPQPPTAPPQTQYQMTAAANGATREQYHAAGWTDEQLIQHGLMLPPGGVQPSFM